MAFSFKKYLPKKKTSEAPPSHPLVRSSAASKVSKPDKKILKKFKSFRSSSGAKFAIIIGDEGAILLYLIGKVVQSRNFIANASADNLKEFEVILSKNKKAPLFVIIDSMDQSFIQQSLPPISSLGVKKLIKRRLDRDLGSNVIKGYVLLERDASGRRDWNFLMVSLENSPHLNLWFDFIERIDNRLSGICLLSVEAENIVKGLDLAMGLPKRDKKSHPGSQWKFFVTHNKVGGFRQVILRDGRIIFTRLTQPVGEINPEVIAGNIEQEMASTIEYMKRLAFKPQQGLDIYVIASSEINNSLDLNRFSEQQIYKFTPFEVAEFLGISGAAQTSDQFGDVILTAFIACSKAHRLVLMLPKALKVNNIYNLMKYQRGLASILLLGIIGYGGVLGLGLLQKYSEIENLNQKKVAQQRRYDELNAEIKKSGIDIRKIDDTVILYNKIGTEAQSPVAVLSRLRAAITPSVKIQEVNWQGSDPKAPAGTPATDKIDNISLLLRFPDISNTEETFNIIAKKVMTEVRAAFPEYKVVYSKLPDILNKKTEGGEISFDEKKTDIKIESANLEATLSLTKLPPDQIPAQAAVPAAGAIPMVQGLPVIPGIRLAPVAPPGTTPIRAVPNAENTNMPDKSAVRLPGDLPVPLPKGNGLAPGAPPIPTQPGAAASAPPALPPNFGGGIPGNMVVPDANAIKAANGPVPEVKKITNGVEK